MSNTLKDIAQTLKNSKSKVQLIYAFNGTGKTRLSKEFQKLINKNRKTQEDIDDQESLRKILYYNAFTEDLFYWDNDLENDAEPKLKIQPNTFTDWILTNQGRDGDIIKNFQYYCNTKLTPKFNKDYSEITFSFETGDDKAGKNIKISKGEESNFLWSIFYSLFEQVIDVLNNKEEEKSQFDDLEYIFIDDPVSSLDENHLIEMAVNIAKLIKLSELKFIITTHNPLFYNVLYNEIGVKNGMILRKNEDGLFELEEKKGDSNKSFSYHLYLKQIIELAIENKNIQKYHFTLLRNLYEKTACFLGYPGWSELLPDNKKLYYNRIIQFTSHSTLSNEVIAEPTDPEKQMLTLLLNNLTENYNFWKKVENHE